MPTLEQQFATILGGIHDAIDRRDMATYRRLADERERLLGQIAGVLPDELQRLRDEPGP